MTQLEVRANQLVSTECLSQSTLLKKAYLGANAIESVRAPQSLTPKQIKGLEGLVNLTRLHLRDNKITKLDGFTEDLRDLSYINLRANTVTTIEQLDKLACLPALASLVLTDCPITTVSNYRLEAIIRLPKLVKLDKDVISDEERDEAEVYKGQVAAEAAERAEEEKRIAEEKLAAGEEDVVEEAEEEKVGEEDVVVAGEEKGEEEVEAQEEEDEKEVEAEVEAEAEQVEPEEE